MGRYHNWGNVLGSVACENNCILNVGSVREMALFLTMTFTTSCKALATALQGKPEDGAVCVLKSAV